MKVIIKEYELSVDVDHKNVKLVTSHRLTDGSVVAAWSSVLRRL
jgi:hypothetical protein